MSECPFGPAGPTAVEVPACPFATEAGFYEPRRLSILDFLLWMTVAAAMLGVRVTLAEEPAGRASGWLYGGYQAVLAICGAACVVGLGHLVLDKARCVPGRLQPGHWLLAICAANCLWGFAVELAFNVCGWQELTTEGQRWRLGAYAVASGADFLIASFLAGRRHWPVVWRLAFGVLAIHSAIWTASIGFIFSIESGPFSAGFLWWSLYRYIEWAGYALSLLFVLVVPAAMFSDLICGRRRDHLHWIGATVAVLQFLWSFVTFVLVRFLGVSFL